MIVQHDKSVEFLFGNIFKYKPLEKPKPPFYNKVAELETDLSFARIQIDTLKIECAILRNYLQYIDKRLGFILQGTEMKSQESVDETKNKHGLIRQYLQELKIEIREQRG